MQHETMHRRVNEARVGRLATIRPDGTPHVVPCCFAVVADELVTAVDRKPKTTAALQRLANVAHHPMASLLVDHYDEDWSALWWVRVDGRARVVAAGTDFERAVRALTAKYTQYASARPTGPAIVLDRLTWRAWP